VIPQFLKPKQTIDETDVHNGLRMLLFDGIASQVMGTLTGGAFLVAFALIMGASNFTIGLIAAIAPFTQILQIPAVFLVERTRTRKVLVVSSSFVSRLFWVVIAITPWIVPVPYRIPTVLISLMLYFGLGAISGCAFSSWMRDLIPTKNMGSYFGRRMTIAAAVGAFLSVAAGFYLDAYKSHFGNDLPAYSFMMLVGACAGIIGITFLSRIPEPPMAQTQDRSLSEIILEPFRDGNFRSLLFFLGSWNFAVNLVSPFFVVYMLERLGMNMAFIVGFAVISQIMNVVFFRVWGRLSDRFSNKSALAISGPLFMISIALWPFTTMPEKYIFTIPLLIVIHILAGISTAGVALCSGNIALKLAPKGKATSYLATNAIVSGAAATIAPIIGGIAATWFAGQQLTLSIAWSSAEPVARAFSLTPINFKGLDFLFFIAIIAGIYALHRLLAVQEHGDMERGVVMEEFFGEVRKSVKSISNVAGMRHLTYFPYMLIRGVRRAHRYIRGPSKIRTITF
jgi:MFS family permease